MHYMALTKLLILLSFANGSPVIAKLVLGETYAMPIDAPNRFRPAYPSPSPELTPQTSMCRTLVSSHR